MCKNSYGLIVEGDYDIPVFLELLRRICGLEIQIHPAKGGGVPAFMRKFPRLLHGFYHVTQTAGAVDKAIVIRDADNGNPAKIEQMMRERVPRDTFRFRDGVMVHAVKREMETWLLADVVAINRVALARGGRSVRAVPGQLEEFRDAKQRLMRLLEAAGLQYSPRVCGEVAKEMNLETLRTRCPSFLLFEQKILDP